MWDSSALLPASHEPAATKAQGPRGRVCKPHPRQRLETAKLPVPVPPKRRAQRPRDSGAGRSLPRAWAGRPARSAGDSQLRWGSPNLRAAPGTHRVPRGGAVRQPSSYLLCRQLVPVRGAGDCYFIVSAAHRAGPGDPGGRGSSNSARRRAFPGGRLPLPPPPPRPRVWPRSCPARRPRCPAPRLAGRPAPAACPARGCARRAPSLGSHSAAPRAARSRPPSLSRARRVPLSARRSAPFSPAAPARRLSGGWGGRCQ